jgi:hypothetical protein
MPERRKIIRAQMRELQLACRNGLVAVAGSRSRSGDPEPIPPEVWYDWQLAREDDPGTEPVAISGNEVRAWRLLFRTLDVLRHWPADQSPRQRKRPPAAKQFRDEYIEAAATWLNEEGEPDTAPLAAVERMLLERAVDEGRKVADSTLRNYAKEALRLHRARRASLQG